MAQGSRDAVIRICLKCDKPFKSTGIEYRTCILCRGQNSKDALTAGDFYLHSYGNSRTGKTNPTS